MNPLDAILEAVHEMQALGRELDAYALTRWAEKVEGLAQAVADARMALVLEEAERTGDLHVLGHMHVGAPVAQQGPEVQATVLPAYKPAPHANIRDLNAHALKEMHEAADDYDKLAVDTVCNIAMGSPGCHSTLVETLMKTPHLQTGERLAILKAATLDARITANERSRT
jgi:hypothetical protein